MSYEYNYDATEWLDRSLGPTGLNNDWSEGQDGASSAVTTGTVGFYDTPSQLYDPIDRSSYSSPQDSISDGGVGYLQEYLKSPASLSIYEEPTFLHHVQCGDYLGYEGPERYPDPFRDPHEETNSISPQIQSLASRTPSQATKPEQNDTLESSSATNRCPHCGKSFGGVYAKGNLGRHLRSQHCSDASVYKCQVVGCTREFRRQDALLVHQRRHHSDVDEFKPLQRVQRNKQTAFLGGDNASRLDYAHVDKSKIAIQTPTTQNATGTSDHEHMGTGLLAMGSSNANPIENLSGYLDPAICDQCGMTFKRPSELRRHMKKHSDVAYPCPEFGCSKTFYRSDKLRDHLWQGHGKSANGSEKLQDADHSTSEPIACSECEMSFETQGLLNTHFNRKHNRRYKCEVCDTSFSLMADLRRHENTKHRDVRFSCQVEGCSSNFTRKDALARHVRQQHADSEHEH